MKDNTYTPAMVMRDCLTGKELKGTAHPSDPYEFKQCLDVLKENEGLEHELYKLKHISKHWTNVIDNWEKLTKMYEANCRSHWVGYKEIGMFEFMQGL